MEVRAEPYRKIVINAKPGAAGTAYHRYWGAIGDFLFFLTFVGPFLKKRSELRHVLAADVYSRYRGDPILTLCQANGLIDELWIHSRNTGGPLVYPPEYIEQALRPKPGFEMYRPAIYYDKYLIGPGILDYPVEWLREEMKMRLRYLIPTWNEETTRARFPQLENPYITLHTLTAWKRKRNVISDDMVRGLTGLGMQLVILQFPSDWRRQSYFERLNEIPFVTVIHVKGLVESLSIQRFARIHVGVESSQLLGAAIQDVPVVYWPSYPGSLSMFERDLDIGALCHPVSWESTPGEVINCIQGFL